jgi:hypothetical protein
MLGQNLCQQRLRLLIALQAAQIIHDVGIVASPARRERRGFLPELQRFGPCLAALGTACPKGDDIRAFGKALGQVEELPVDLLVATQFEKVVQHVDGVSRHARSRFGGSTPANDRFLPIPARFRDLGEAGHEGCSLAEPADRIVQDPLGLIQAPERPEEGRTVEIPVLPIRPAFAQGEAACFGGRPVLACDRKLRRRSGDLDRIREAWSLLCQNLLRFIEAPHLAQRQQLALHRSQAIGETLQDRPPALKHLLPVLTSLAQPRPGGGDLKLVRKTLHGRGDLSFRPVPFARCARRENPLAKTAEMIGPQHTEFRP